MAVKKRHLVKVQFLDFFLVADLNKAIRNKLWQLDTRSIHNDSSKKKAREESTHGLSSERYLFFAQG